MKNGKWEMKNRKTTEQKMYNFEEARAEQMKKMQKNMAQKKGYRRQQVQEKRVVDLQIYIIYNLSFGAKKGRT